MKAKRHYETNQPVPDMTVVMLVLAKFCPDAWAKLMTTEVIWTSAVDRAATDGVYIYLNAEFWATINDSQRAFVLAHEILHIWLAHMQRGKFYRQRGFFDSKHRWCHDTWNAAADFIINAYLIRCGLEAPPDICLDDRYNGHELTEEVYASILKDLPEPPPQQDDGGDSADQQQGGDDGQDTDGSDDAGDGDDASPADGQDGQDGQGRQDGQDGQGSQAGQPGPVETPSPGHDQHLEPIYEGTPEEQAEAESEDRSHIQQDIDDAIDQAEAEGRKPGCSDMSASGYRHRGKGVRASNVKWSQKLAHVLTRASRKGGRQNWGKIHRRRLISTGVLTPTRKGRLNLIALTEDISGSVSEAAREKLHRNAAHLLDVLKPTRGLMVLFTNTQVVSTAQVMNGHALLNVEVPHGGGTNMSRSIEYMREKHVVPDVHLIFTDGEMTDTDYAACKKNGSILILDSMPSWHYGDRLRASGIEYIIIDE